MEPKEITCPACGHNAFEHLPLHNKIYPMPQEIGGFKVGGTTTIHYRTIYFGCIKCGHGIHVPLKEPTVTFTFIVEGHNKICTCKYHTFKKLCDGKCDN